MDKEAITNKIAELSEKAETIWSDVWNWITEEWRHGYWMQPVSFALSILIVFLILFNLVITSEQDVLDELHMDEIELSDADYERNGDYYYIGNDFYYKVDIWTGLERVNIIYKVKGKKEQDIEYSDPIEIIKIGQPWKYNYYKKFVKFLKERE